MASEATQEVKAEVVHDSLVSALAAAQGEFPTIEKDREAKIKTKSGGEYSYKYATLDSVLKSCRPVLSRHGIAVCWVYEITDNGGLIKTRLLRGVDVLESVIPVYPGDDMQSLGSAITYAKRYGLCGLIGVVGEEDDDAAGAGTKPPATTRTRKPAPRTGDPPGPQGKTEWKLDPLKLDDWKYAIDHATKLDTLTKLLERCREIDVVKNDLALTTQIIQAVGLRNELAIQKGEWSEEDSRELEQTLDMLRKHNEAGNDVQRTLV